MFVPKREMVSRISWWPGDGVGVSGCVQRVLRSRSKMTTWNGLPGLRDARCEGAPSEWQKMRVELMEGGLMTGCPHENPSVLPQCF